MTDQTKSFGETAKSLARNPLGIIALFIVMVYGFASLVTAFAGSFTAAERLPLIYFLICFPILVLCVFAWLVSKHSGKLFAPSDFRNEDNYVKMQMAVGELKKEVASQQETINQLVIYSLAQIIYRELIWKIGHNLTVVCDHTSDQQRWLTLLLDQGLLEAKDKNKPWIDYAQIRKGENLSDIFKPTLAAEYLMKLRKAPT